MWGPFPVVKRPRLEVTTSSHLASRLRMSGVLRLLPLYALMAWTEKTVPLPCTNQTAKKLRIGWDVARLSFRSAIRAYEMHCCPVTRIRYNCNGDCAFANGFPVLAEGLDVFIPRTSATSSVMPGGWGGGVLVEWISEVSVHCVGTWLAVLPWYPKTHGCVWKFPVFDRLCF